jgi:uncharacterized protein YidB (DUF937 family)
MQQLARQTGQTPEQASSHVAQILPQMMGQATAEEKMPGEDPLSKGMNALNDLVSR